MDPSIGRFTSVDKLADHPSQVDKSVYAYAWNNPILLIDPDGMAPEWPPVNYSGTFWEDEGGTFTRNSSSDMWDWTDCDGVCQGSGLSPMYLPSPAIESRGFVDALAVMAEGILYETGKYLGLENEDAVLAASTVLIINDLKKLKVNKVIKNVDDLLEAAGKFSKGKKTREGANKLKGNIDDVFKTITEGGEVLEGGAVKLPDGTFFKKYTSSSGGEPSISINKPDQTKLKKVRFEKE
jgi:hypothetical protein